jgi:hypothetical protein
MTEEILRIAAKRASLVAGPAQLIRDGSNTIYRLADDIVARIGRPGTGAISAREVKVSQWLGEHGIQAVQPVADVPQDIIVDDRPVTWWRNLPPHRPATPAELAATAARIHSLPFPDVFDLPEHDPFAGVSDCIADAADFDESDRSWLTDQHRKRQDGYDNRGRKVVIHGDAWQGNLAVTESGSVIVLDLEHFSIGRPEWDLVQIAVDYTDFARITEVEYRAFVESYGGFDITTSPEYRTFADIQELRWLCFALRKAATDPRAIREAHHRIECLRGDHPRPWRWNPL